MECALCLLILVSMRWFCTLYTLLRVFGKVCIGQSFEHELWHGGSQKRARACSRAAWSVLVGVS